MFRADSIVVGTALAIVALTAPALAQPQFSYLSQSRSVRAMTFVRATAGSDRCDAADDPPDPICEGITTVRTDSTSDAGLFSALVHPRLQSDNDGNFAGVFSRVEQNSMLAPDSIATTLSLAGQEDTGQNGNSIDSFRASGESTLSASFSLSAAANVRFSADLASSVNYDADGSLYAASAFARLTSGDGTIVFDTADGLPPFGPLTQQIDRVLVLPAGEYDFYTHVTAYAPNSTHYDDPGRIDLELVLTIKSAAVPEPTSLALIA